MEQKASNTGRGKWQRVHATGLGLDPTHEPDADLAALEEILRTAPAERGTLIPLLQRAQRAYGYLPRSVILRIAQHQGIPAAEVYGVATFYAQFYLKPQGRHRVRACRGTACHVRGATEMIRAIGETLGIQDGETTDDMKFTLETVACLGTCSLAPVMLIDDVYYGKLTPDRVKAVLANY